MERNLLKEYGLGELVGDGIYYQENESFNQETDEKQCQIFANSLWEWQNEKRKQLGVDPLDYATEWKETNERFIKQMARQISERQSDGPKTIMIINNQSGDHQIAILCVRDDLPAPLKVIEDLYQVKDCRRILENPQYSRGVTSVFYDQDRKQQYYLARFLK